jgi:hypothetical protein
MLDSDKRVYELTHERGFLRMAYIGSSSDSRVARADEPSSRKNTSMRQKENYERLEITKVSKHARTVL